MYKNLFFPLQYFGVAFKYDGNVEKKMVVTSRGWSKSLFRRCGSSFNIEFVSGGKSFTRENDDFERARSITN